MTPDTYRFSTRGDHEVERTVELEGQEVAAKEGDVGVLAAFDVEDADARQTLARGHVHGDLRRRAMNSSTVARNNISPFHRSQKPAWASSEGKRPGSSGGDIFRSPPSRGA